MAKTKKKKGSKGKKKGKKGLKNVSSLSPVTQTFYELTIADLNRKLARLRAESDEFQKMFSEATDILKKDKIDKEDVAAILERDLKEKENKIKEMKKEIQELVTEIETKETTFNRDLKKCNENTLNLKKELTSRIAEQSVKIISLEKFKEQQATFLKKYEKLEIELEKEKLTQKEIVNKLKTKSLKEKEILKSEFRNQLYKLTYDFQEANKIKVPNYVKKILIENIRFKVELDELIKYQKELNIECARKEQKIQEMNNICLNNKMAYDKLLKSSKSHIDMIEKLTNQCEHLKSKFYLVAHSKKMYEEMLKSDCTKDQSINILQEELLLRKKYCQLKEEHNKIVPERNLLLNEVDSLKALIEKIKFCVIAVKCDDKINNINYHLRDDFKIAYKESLSEDILHIINSYYEKLMVASSLSSVSISSSVKEIDKNLVKNVSFLRLQQQQCEEVEAKTDEIKKIEKLKVFPCFDTLDKRLIFDEESGSSLIISSLHSKVVVEELDDNEGGEEYESSFESSLEMEVEYKKSNDSFKEKQHTSEKVLAPKSQEINTENK